MFPEADSQDFISLNDIEDVDTRLDATRQKLKLLPEAHMVLLQAMMQVLVAIADNHSENGMTGSLMWECLMG